MPWFSSVQYWVEHWLYSSRSESTGVGMTASRVEGRTVSRRRDDGRRVLAIACAIIAGMGLVPAPAAATHPGTNGRIAYQHASEIRSVRPDGTGVRRLHKEVPYPNVHPVAWAPNGRRLLFWKNYYLWTMGRHGRNRRRLAYAPAPDGASWSPNGRWIVYARNISKGPYDNTDVFRMRADGSGVKRLTRTPGDLLASRAPTWSPDGKKIAFLREVRHDLNYKIFLMDTDGRNVRRISPGDGLPRVLVTLDWSPNGEELLGVAMDPACSGDLDYYDPNRMLFRFNVAKRTVIPLHTCTTFGTAAWSPDGRRIAGGRVDFGAKRGGGIYVLKRDGTVLRRIVTPYRTYAILPTWGAKPS